MSLKRTMTQEENHNGSLSAINVLDFGHYYAGPMAALLLADQGANVIRFIRPGATDLPAQQHRLLNRNKKILTIDLKTPEGKAQALSLVEHADVVIENFRPGVMKRLGLDYASLKSRNPGLIYLSLPGFASTDKERAHIQAWEGILSAAAGIYKNASSVREMLNYPPLYSSVPICSVYGALNGALAIMAALLARERQNGTGTKIEVPLLNAGLFAFFVNFYFMKSSPGPLTALVDPDDGIPDTLKPFIFLPEDSQATQIDKLDKAEQILLNSSPSCKTYSCSDGRQIYIWTYNNVRFTELFYKALGIDKKVKQEGFVNEGPWKVGLNNNLGDSYGMSADRKEWLIQSIDEVFLSKTAKEWEKILSEAGVPAAVIRTRSEWLELEPMLSSGVLTKMYDGETELTVPGRIVDINGPEEKLINGFSEAKPITFQEAETLFIKDVPRKASTNQGEPLKKSDLLKGLKVLDLSNVAAGPLAGHVLAQYGADVIKADHEHSYLDPGAVRWSPTVLEGKRTILIDVKTAPGRELFQKLVSWADVVLHNILDDTAQRLGATHKQLQAINPNVVSCQISAYGGTLRNGGGWEARPGFDPLLQGASGLLSHYGTLEKPLHFAGVACGDITGGFALAFSVLLGVYQKSRTGYAGEGRTSLARTISFSQLPWLMAKDECSDWGERSGQFAVGENWWKRIYKCSDGWIYVDTGVTCAEALLELIIGQKSGDEKSLEAAFIKHNCTHWIDVLSQKNIACHPVLSLEDICNRENIRDVDNEEADEVVVEGSAEFLRWKNHPCGIPVTLLAPTWVRVGENNSWKRLKAAVRLGSHTKDILREIGHKNDEIAELIRIKAVYEYLPSLGDKDKYFFEPDHIL